MFFGTDIWNASTTRTIKPVPIGNITQTYSLAQQAALNAYLSGKIATAFVPGRLQEVKLVFQSSLPQVIASTVLLGLVTIFMVASHLRLRAEKFSLFSVATTLVRSNIPDAFEGAREDLGEQMAVDSMRDRKIRLDAGRTLQIL